MPKNSSKKSPRSTDRGKSLEDLVSEDLGEVQMDELIRKEARRLEQIIIRAIMKSKQRS